MVMKLVLSILGIACVASGLKQPPLRSQLGGALRHKDAAQKLQAQTQHRATVFACFSVLLNAAPALAAQELVEHTTGGKFQFTPIILAEASSEVTSVEEVGVAEEAGKLFFFAYVVFSLAAGAKEVITRVMNWAMGQDA